MAEKLDEKAAAIAGAVTAAVMHLLMGVFFVGMGGTAIGMYNMMMYMNGINYNAGTSQLVFGTIAALIAGAIVGLVIAVSYNWALKKS